MTWVFSIVSTAVVVGIIVFARRIRSMWWAIVLGMLLGGALGNLLDRLFREPGFGRGHVVDFISTPWMMPAIYNIADAFICVSMVVFVLLVILGVNLDGSRAASDKQRRTSTDEPLDAGAAFAAPSTEGLGADVRAADVRAADARTADARLPSAGRTTAAATPSGTTRRERAAVPARPGRARR